MSQSKLIKQQQGVVLFIALIALVVMSLAAAALIRSVDTNATIAGNLSFRQSALIAADMGAETAMKWLENSAVNNLDSLNNSLRVSGYYANYGNLNGDNVNLDDTATIKNDNTWDDYSAPASGTGIDGSGLHASSQNKIEYIIERMCSTDNAKPANDATNKCLFGPGSDENSGKQVLDSSEAGGNKKSGLSPVYRVTVRVTGPKNSQSYTQLYVY